MSDHSTVAASSGTSYLHTCNTTTVTVTTTSTVANAGLSASGQPPPPPPPNGDDARRLFMGNLPKVKSEVEICEEVSRYTNGLVRVITYKNFENPLLHRGFCFLDFESGGAAAEAKRQLSRCTVFGCKTIVDWADPEPEPDAQQMAAVRILFVRQYGGTLDESTLADVFGRYGAVERVKNLKNYAFVHFERRSDALDAMNALDGAVDEASGVRVDVSWAKPPAEKHIRERVLRDRERRIRMQVHGAHRPPSPCSSANITLASNANATPAPATGFVVPYSNYDHYEYDFGRKTFACTCRVDRSVETEPLRRQQERPLLRRPEQQPPPRRPEQPPTRRPEQRQRYRCSAGVSDSEAAAAEAAAADGELRRAKVDDGDSGKTWRQQQRKPLQQRNAVETTSLAGSPTARNGHGDCATDISDLDSIILNFFHKKGHTARNGV